MDVQARLLGWLHEQPLWQQTLADLLISTVTLGQGSYERALAMVLEAHDAARPDGSSTLAPTPFRADRLVPEGSGIDWPRLVSFGQLTNVGIAVDDSQIEFAPTGVTVIYGPNGSGKSTYVRALKRIARTVDLQQVLRGDAFTAPSSDSGQSAVVGLERAGQREEREVDLGEPDLVIEGLSVFDARCAELYVNARNQVAFVPSILKLLTRLALLQGRMRDDIEQFIADLDVSAPDFSDVPEGVVHDVLSGLGEDTDLEELERLTRLADSELARFNELKAVLASDAEAQIQADAAAASADAKLADEAREAVTTLIGALEPANVTELRTAHAALRDAEAAVSAARVLFADDAINGIGGAAWRAMWESARGFMESHAADFPPREGQACPLCLQSLAGTSAERLRAFEQHITSDLQQRAELAGQRLLALRATFDPALVNEVRVRHVEPLRERAGGLHKGLLPLLDRLEVDFASLQEDPDAVVESLDAAVLERVRSWSSERRAHADMLRAAQDPEQRKALEQEVQALQARVMLRDRWAEVQQRVDDLRRRRALNTALASLATNRISLLQRELTELVVTGSLADALDLERKALRCDHVPVGLSAAVTVGDAQVSLRLLDAPGNAPLREILSEGEQRALALAFFFAEVAQDPGGGGIVLDDPVSSLDEERRHHIADRLLNEASKRQVIVFTHDLPFLLDLQQQADNSGVAVVVRAIWRYGDRVGRVDMTEPFAAMSLKKRVATLKQEVQNWDAHVPTSVDAAWNRVSDFYRRLRQAWERAVEERLFGGVIQRYSREVKTKSLDACQLNADNIARVEEGMTRCSEFVHDQPPPAGAWLPGRADLAQDLEKLVVFEGQTRS